MQQPELKGVIAAIPTPFHDSEELAEEELAAVVRHVVSNGVHGIMTTGGTGEFPALSREERRRVTEIVAAEVAHRVPVVAGIAAGSTRECLLLGEDAAAAGADAVIATPPYYFPLPVSSLRVHFSELAKSLSLGLVIYNNPLYTGNNVSAALIGELAQVKGIIGLKQSNPNFGELVEAIRLAGQRISISTGIDSHFYPALCAGAAGIYSTAAAVVPREMVRLYRLYQSGAHDEARDLHLRLQTLNRFLEYDPGYVSPCKEALRMLGIPAGVVRRPLPRLSAEERAQIQTALRGLDYDV